MNLYRSINLSFSALNFFLILFCIILFSNPLLSQELSGKVADENNAPLKNVLVSVTELNKFSYTDEEGKYSFENIPTGTYTIVFQRIGYQTKSIEKDLQNGDQTIDANLAPNDLRLGEAVVTSARFTRLTKDNPISFELIQEQEISKKNPIAVADLFASESGVVIERDGIWASTINIRGLSRNNVVALIDGQRLETATDLSAALSLIEPSEIERVEVIKGAASSLYGTGALGGVINLLTKKPSFSDNLYLQPSLYASHSTVNEMNRGRVSLTGGARNWFFRASGSYKTANNAQTPRGEIPNSFFNDNSVSLMGGVRLFNSHELNVNYDRFFAWDVGVSGGAPLFPSQADVRYPKTERELISIGYEIKGISSSWLSFSTKIYKQNILREVENIPHIVNNIPAQGGAPARRISVLSILPEADHELYGFQLQSDFRVAENNFLAAGVDVWQRSYEGFRERNFLIEILNDNDETIQTTNRTVLEKPLPNSSYFSGGVFAQNEYVPIKNKLKINVGGRIDLIRVNNDETLNILYEEINGVRNEQPQGQTVIWEEQEADDISWSVNASTLYSVSENLDLTLSLSRSFRSPALEERYQYIDLGGFVRVGSADLKPEEGYFVDFGSRIWLEKFSFSGNLFYNFLENLVAEVPGSYEGRDAFIKTNIGEARLYGYDFTLEYNPIKNLTFYGGGSYVRGEDVLNNNNLPQIPPLNGRLGIKSSILKFADFDINMIAFNRQEQIADGELETPGYVTFNLYLTSKSITFDYATVKLFGGIENIFDKFYRNHLATNRGDIIQEPGRNIFIGISVN